MIGDATLRLSGVAQAGAGVGPPLAFAVETALPLGAAFLGGAGLVRDFDRGLGARLRGRGFGFFCRACAHGLPSSTVPGPLTATAGPSVLWPWPAGSWRGWR